MRVEVFFFKFYKKKKHNIKGNIKEHANNNIVNNITIFVRPQWCFIIIIIITTKKICYLFTLLFMLMIVCPQNVCNNTPNYREKEQRNIVGWFMHIFGKLNYNSIVDFYCFLLNNISLLHLSVHQPPPPFLRIISCILYHVYASLLFFLSIAIISVLFFINQRIVPGKKNL